MKTIIMVWLSIATWMLVGCADKGTKKEMTAAEMANMKTDSLVTTPAADEKEVKNTAVTFTNLDARLASGIKEIVSHYLHIKNALANDNASEAANGGKALNKAIGSIDKSLLTEEQKKLFDENQDDVKEHAEHIGKNGSNIKHQREHFALLSEDIYALVKNFGGGLVLYHDHCPMYNENKGAMWLSEMKEVKNPYYGAEMLTCGTVEEIIK